MSDEINTVGNSEEVESVTEKKATVYCLTISQIMSKYQEAEKVAEALNLEIQIALRLVLSEKYRSWQVAQLQKLIHPSSRWAFKVLKYIHQHQKIEWDSNKYPFKIEEDGTRPVDRLRTLFSYNVITDGVTKKNKPNWGTYLGIAEACLLIGWIEE